MAVIKALLDLTVVNNGPLKARLISYPFCSKFHRKCLAFSLQVQLIVTALLYAQTPIRIRETNPNYDQGDWVSYSVARFVTSIAVGTQYVYFGTVHSGITRLDQFSNRWDFPWTTSNGLADNEISAVAFDVDTGYLWCASQTAVSYYHPTAQRWNNQFKDEFGVSLSDDIESIGIAASKILFMTRSGRLFESSKFGGIILVGNTSFGNPLRDPNIRWFGRAAAHTKLPHFMMGNGYLFDPSGIVEDFNFRQAKVVAAVPDDWGNVWVGTWGLGAGKGDTRSLQLEMLDFGLVNTSVRGLNLQEETLWIGGAESNSLKRRGITAWDLKRQTWHSYDQRNITDLASDQINSITVDGDNIWFSTGHGLTQYSTSARRWKTYDRFDGLSDNIVFDVAVNDSAIWVATASGIDKILKKSLAKKDSLRIRPVSPGNLLVVPVYDLEFFENLLWAGTNRGIYIFDVKKNEGGFSDEIDGPTSNVIKTISRYRNELWFGSLEGVDVFDVMKQEWLGVPKGRAFPSTPINRIFAGEKAVWAATDRGVLKYNRRTNSWKTFTVEDGLIDNHVNAILPDGDNIWFGTEGGLTQFHWNSPNRID